MAIKVKRIKTETFRVGTDDIRTDKTLVEGQIGFERPSGNLKICDDNEIKDVIKNIEGNAKTATQLAAACTIQTNLASTSAASFNGTANITTGVTGTLPVTNGGTGQSAALTSVDRTFLARKSSNQGSTSSGNVGFRAIEVADLPTGATSSTVSLGNHTHSYAGSSSAGGAATSANKVNQPLSIQFNGGTATTFDGSTARSINITPSSIGAATTNHDHFINGVAFSVVSSGAISHTTGTWYTADYLRLLTIIPTGTSSNPTVTIQLSDNPQDPDKGVIFTIVDNVPISSHRYSFNVLVPKNYSYKISGISVALTGGGLVYYCDYK